MPKRLGLPFLLAAVLAPAALAAAALAPAAQADRAGSSSPGEDPGVVRSSHGSLVFVDRTVGPRDPATAARIRANARTTATAPTLAEVLSRHSLPGSKHTIFLDFNGYTLPSVATWVSQFGMDPGTYTGSNEPGGKLSEITAAERIYMQDVWRIVAEKYKAFDVDVTTEDPGSAALTNSPANPADDTWGTRVVITDDASARVPDSDLVPGGCPIAGCTGMAQVGSFDQLSPTPERFGPAWVYTTLKFPGQSAFHLTAGETANTAAHEVGHTLGLFHDGTSSNPDAYNPGHDSWFPIMGSSDRAIGQFNNGGFTNQVFPLTPPPGTPNKDDLDVISKNGAPFRADDVPATSPLGQALSYTVAGVISSDADSDAFTVDRTCTDTLSVSATGIGMGQALDIRLTVTKPNASTVVVDPPSGTSSANTVPDTPTGMNATTSIAAAPTGTWAFTVEGTGLAGSGGYPGYGSIGGYTLKISGCPPPGSTPPSAPVNATPVSGTKGGIATATANWKQPASTGGSPVTGYRVIAYKTTPAGTVLGSTISPLLASTARTYKFTLPAGRYKFRIVAYNVLGRSPYSAYSKVVLAQ